MAAAHITHLVDAIVSHEVRKVTGRDIAFASTIKALKGRIRLECLRLAQILATELNALLALTRISE